MLVIRLKVKGYSLTNSNYVSAVETLKIYFRKKHFVINSKLITKLITKK